MNLVEIFASAQGEGPHVGRSTVFVRFGECDLRCAWCDSPGTWRPAKQCRIERSAGSAEFESVANPLTPARVDAALGVLAPAVGSFLSLTGGEPLLQPDAVLEVAKLGRRRGLRVQLETHGLALAGLERVVAAIDVVSMDWKLASDVAPADAPRGQRVEFGTIHQAFLALARAHCDVYVKVVVSPNTRADELDAVCRALAEGAPDVPLVLQPVTPAGRIRSCPDAATLLAHLRRCERIHADVRLIPQTHRAYGAL